MSSFTMIGSFLLMVSTRFIVFFGENFRLGKNTSNKLGPLCMDFPPQLLYLAKNKAFNNILPESFICKFRSDWQ